MTFFIINLFSRPMVMLVGQYSTGKTTFIRYLLEQDFPGIRIGPEPTTDRSGGGTITLYILTIVILMTSGSLL